MAIDILIAGRLPPNVLPQLEKRFRLHQLPEERNEAGAFLQEVGGSIRGMLTNAAQGAPEQLLSALPKLEIISSSGVGTDALNMDIAQARGISVRTTPGVLTEDVADGAIALMLATSRRLMQAERNGLDVLADEPHVPDALLELENVVLTPHYASGTTETRLAMGQRVVDNLLEYFEAELQGAD